MKIEPAKRVSGIRPYFFAELEKTISQLKQSGMDIIRLDMGSPDLPPQDFIISELIRSAQLPDMHGYSQSGGSISLRKAFSQYYQDRFDVCLDPEEEIVGLIGSKEGLFHLSQIIVDPEDVVLVPDPCYPVYNVGTRIAQGKTYSMPLLAENGFLPKFNNIPESLADKAKIMWLNYPNNPTGAIAPYEFLEEAVKFARLHNIIIAHDAPYLDVCFDDYKAHSLLEVHGAKEVAVEFNSVSKTYNMAGWRVGVAAGHSEIIRLLRTYKSQLDSSYFKPIMAAAEAALLGDQSWIRERNCIYQNRRDTIVDTLKYLGFSLEIPKASLYVWAKLPNCCTDSIAFCRTLLNETGVSLTPGVVYGKSGEGYVRISLVTPREHLIVAMDRIADWMKE